jgi:hypothetical protein
LRRVFMSNLKILGSLIVIALVVAGMSLISTANLVATTFGFPVIVQNGSTCAFNQDFARAHDYENINLTWAPFDSCGNTLGPTALTGDDALVLNNGQYFEGTASANVLPFGPGVDLAFPSISQDVTQEQTVSHCDFAQTNEYAEFAYPFVGVGPVSLPGFGFGW